MANSDDDTDELEYKQVRQSISVKLMRCSFHYLLVLNLPEAEGRLALWCGASVQ